MPRAALSQSQVEEFRVELCDHAMRLFADRGYEGVTLRALAESLGCSPMTPYRYFENKGEIFEAVRAMAADRFADALEYDLEGVRGHPQILAALTRSYVRFALEQPHALRVIFELDQGSPNSSAKPKTVSPAELRSWSVLSQAVERAVADGFLDGEPQTVAHLFWSSVHGMVTLHLAGKLKLGRTLGDLVEAFIQRELNRPDLAPT